MHMKGWAHGLSVCKRQIGPLPVKWNGDYSEWEEDSEPRSHLHKENIAGRAVTEDRFSEPTSCIKHYNALWCRLLYLVDLDLMKTVKKQKRNEGKCVSSLHSNSGKCYNSRSVLPSSIWIQSWEEKESPFLKVYVWTVYSWATADITSSTNVVVLLPCLSTRTVCHNPLCWFILTKLMCKQIRPLWYLIKFSMLKKYLRSLMLSGYGFCDDNLFEV